MPYEKLFEQIAEGRRELDHISRAFQRVEHLCKSGSDHFLDAQRMMSELDTLSGWVVSLLETDISMVEIVAPSRNPLSKRATLDYVKRELKRPKLMGLYL